MLPRRGCLPATASKQLLSLLLPPVAASRAAPPHRPLYTEPLPCNTVPSCRPQVKLLTSANSKKVKRGVWEEQVTQLIVDGLLRRGHLNSLINAVSAQGLDPLWPPSPRNPLVGN